jgi:hypothetical protein
MSGESCGLFVAKVNRFYTQILSRHYDIEIRSTHQVEKDLYPFFLQCASH